jgi:prolipoprotein diacylglyceryl transferase
MVMLANIPPPPGNAVELGPLTIHYYGVAIAIGVLVAISIARRRYARAGGDPDLADKVAIFAVIAGLVGARVGFVTTNYDRFFWDDPLGVFAVWQGGLTFYTGLLFGALGAIWFLRRGGGSLPGFADAAAPAIPIAQAFGRWGNYFNQELYGTPTDLPWALVVEPHRRVAGFEAFETFHPTFLYEMLGNLVIAGLLLWVGSKRKLAAGSLLFGYLIGYGVLRFGMELLRIDTEPVLLGLTRNGLGSIAVVLIGVAGLWVQQRRPLLPDWSQPAETEPPVEAEPPAEAERPAGDSTAQAPGSEADQSEG